MKILALEFSSPQRSAALVESSALDTPGVLGAASEIGGRSTRAVALIEDVLRKSQCEREAIDCLAIGLGPGSYTGIRSAIALAQGWQLGRPLKITGISSVEALARQARAAGRFGTVNIVVDAQRNELYVARYEITATICRELEPLRLAGIAEVEARETAGETILSPDIPRWESSQVQAKGPTAVWLALMAAEKKLFASAETLEPIYLRETRFVKAPPSRARLD